MSGNSAKRLINWHTGWLGEKDVVGDWAQYSDKKQFKCWYCDVERKYSNGGRTSLIQHSESHKHKKNANGQKQYLLNVEVFFFVKCRRYF